MNKRKVVEAKKIEGWYLGKKKLTVGIIYK